MMDFVSWDDDVHNIWKNNQNVPNHQPAMWCSMWLCSYQSIPKRVTYDTQLESKPGTIDFMNKTPVNDDSCAKPNSTVNLQFWREFSPSISDLEISWGLFTSGFTLFKLDEPNFIPFPAKCCSCPISRLGETFASLPFHSAALGGELDLGGARNARWMLTPWPSLGGIFSSI